MSKQAIALEAGFYKGRRVRAGAEFTVTGDLPKWAAIKGTPEAVVKPAAVMADTKPAATQKAVKAKVAGAADA